MKLLRKVGSIFDVTNNLLFVLMTILLVYLVIFISLEVVMRRFLGIQMNWVMDVSEFILLWIPFLGAAWLLKREGHVKMDIVLNRFRPGTQYLINTITSTLGALACLVIAWASARGTLEFFQTGEVDILATIQPPLFLVLLVIPVGSFLLFIQLLRRAYGYLRSWRAS